MDFKERFKGAWNAFLNRDPTYENSWNSGPSFMYRPDRPRFSKSNSKSIVTPIFNRIAIDASTIDIRHVRLDDEGRYIRTEDSGLNACLNLEANVDQSGSAFMQDVVMSMLDEGCVAIVPTDTSRNVFRSSGFDIYSMRVGKITEWFPDRVRIKMYNERKGIHEEVVLPKRTVAIVENPLYAVVNEQNSTLKRLIQKLNLLDVIDNQSSSSKLDLIIQLPYVIKTKARKDQAEMRRQDIEQQLTNSKYGIAYTDGTEKITQLNRPVENNLMHQIEFLTSMLYSQLGITKEILDGSADEKAMLAYYKRSVNPIMSAIVNEMKRKFLTPTARTQGQSIMAFNNPFEFVTVSDLSEIADKMTRNEIMTSNEIRQYMGLKPSDDPSADELRNKNLNKQSPEEPQYDDYQPDNGYSD